MRPNIRPVVGTIGEDISWLGINLAAMLSPGDNQPNVEAKEKKAKTRDEKKQILEISLDTASSYA